MSRRGQDLSVFLSVTPPRPHRPLLLKNLPPPTGAALTPSPLGGGILVLVWFGFLKQEFMEARLPSNSSCR